MTNNATTTTTAGNERSWRSFAAWMLPGACLGLLVSAVGIFTLVPGLILADHLSRRRPAVDAFGLLAGVGVTVAWIGSINLHYQACSSTHNSASLPAGATHPLVYSCGGVNGKPWLIVGVAAVIIAIALYALATRVATGLAASHQ